MPQQMDSFVNVTLDGILIQMQQTANRVILVEQIDLKHFEIHVLIQDPLWLVEQFVLVLRASGFYTRTTTLEVNA